MVDLNYTEQLLINGGSQETYDAGYNIGNKIKTFVVDVCDWVKGFFDGLK